MRFRKKSVEVEAIPVKAALHFAATKWSRLPKWLADAYEKGDVMFGNKYINIRTLEGMMTAMINDWIIKGVEGELYPCKPGIFQKTYDSID